MNLFEIFINLLQISLFVYFIYRALPIKRELFFIMSLTLLVFLAITTLLNLFHVSSVLTAFFGLCYEVLFTICFTRSSLGKKVFYGCIPMVISLLSDSITFTALSTIFQDYSSALIKNTDTRNQALCIFILTVAILTLLIVRLISHDLKFPRFLK